jgi:hypothetical protein
MADQTRENAAEDSPTPAETCVHHDAKTNKRCEKARVAGRMYCQGHESAGGGGGGTCYIKMDRPDDDKDKFI